MSTIIIYDDTRKKSEAIADIIGDKLFGDVVVKKRCLSDYFHEEMRKTFPYLKWRRVRTAFEYTDILKSLDLAAAEDRVIHCFSNYLISDPALASLSFKKLNFIEEPYAMRSGKGIVASLFPDTGSYAQFLKAIISGEKAWDLSHEFREGFEIEGVVDIGIISNFIQCVTGNFDSRYFNTLKGDEYTLVKSSSNRKKIKAEYDFYHLLPDDMKYWFVMPFDFADDGNQASYRMERLHMTDLAIKWVHGSMETEEFETLLDKYFFFFNGRHERPCTKEKYEETARELYIDKVRDRLTDLKAMGEYKKIESLLSASDTAFLDNLYSEYLELKGKIEDRINYPHVEVIGHGDPCFANTLYNRSTQTLKFIDPKGAVDESGLWTNPYYDIAKLSHSISGRYDFFNNGLFEIRLAEDFSFSLEIPFDNTEYIGIFRRKAEENGFDYLSIRIYEASLFLSMLPLHIDNPHKVFGFILNARNILNEIRSEMEKI